MILAKIKRLQKEIDRLQKEIDRLKEEKLLHEDGEMDKYVCVISEIVSLKIKKETKNNYYVVDISFKGGNEDTVQMSPKSLKELTDEMLKNKSDTK